MSVRFLTVSCVLALVLSAGAANPLDKKVEDFRKEVGKQKLDFSQMADELEKFRGTPEFATNADTRALIDLKVVELCRRPQWPLLHLWRQDFEKRIPAVCRRGLAETGVSAGRRIRLAAYLAEWLSGEKKYDDAVAVLKKELAVEGLTKTDASFGTLALADVYRWRDDFDSFWKTIDAAAKLDFGAAAKKAFQVGRDLGDTSRGEAMMTAANLPLARQVEFYISFDMGETDKVRKLKLQLIKDEKAGGRVNNCAYWFGADRSELGVEARAAVRGMKKNPSDGAWMLERAVGVAYAKADWALVREQFEVFDGCKVLESPRMQRMKIGALAADNLKDEALKTVRANLAAETAKDLKPLDAAKFRVIEAILSGKDPVAAVAAEKLERKDEMAVVKYVAGLATEWELAEASEMLAAKYAAWLVDFPQRELKVKFSKETILSVADWRKIYDTLDRQVCDREFKFSADLLVTDVATNRKIAEKTEEDSVDVAMEVSAVCDTKGVHVFTRVKDPKARAVEEGFASGITAEMYFAPGKYEPYVCFGSDPRKGVDGVGNGFFHTVYDNAAATRPDFGGLVHPGAFRHEVAFTDNDYVLHLFFAWDTFYQKLPTNGSKWRYECLSYGPKGAFSLGGSKSVHNSSRFADLVFDLKPEDVTAIRRAVICRTVRSWSKLGYFDRFEKWADPELGDPAFYEEVLKPIEQELKGYAKEVKADMTDADVNRIYEKACVRWIGISHEIDRLRREWLMERETCR